MHQISAATPPQRQHGATPDQPVKDRHRITPPISASRPSGDCAARQDRLTDAAKNGQDQAEGHPMMDDQAYSVAADELRQFIEQFEQLEAEKKDITERQKEVMGEAKARGYDTKVMKKIVALRKRDRDDIAEEEAILEMYKQALGMG
jgi:uncharacterized protein (UPF0335 family)